MKVFNVIINEHQRDMLVEALRALPDPSIMRPHAASNGLWSQSPRTLADEMEDLIPGCINGLTV